MHQFSALLRENTLGSFTTVDPVAVYPLACRSILVFLIVDSARNAEKF